MGKLRFGYAEISLNSSFAILTIQFFTRSHPFPSNRIYMSQSIDPLQLAVRYQPPQLALIYSRAGETLVHQLPLSPEDLDEEAYSVVQHLRQRHPCYLDSIPSEQLIRLVEMIQLHQDLIARGATYQDRPLEQEEEEGQIDFMAIERDLDYQPEDDL